MENGCKILGERCESLQEENITLNSKNRLRQLLDIVPYPLLVTDQNSITYYLNPGFTETFGWTLDELVGKKIMITPPEKREETREKIRKLVREGMLELQETRRMTKDGRILDVAIRSAYHGGQGDEPENIVTILRDVTQDKKNARINDAMHRISMALPGYTALGDLMDYISLEIKELLDCEGATILLLDSKKREFFTIGSAYEDGDKRRRELRFPMDVLVATRVIETGEPVVTSESFGAADFQQNRDGKSGYNGSNLVEVPLKSGNRIFGVLGAVNKKEGSFENADIELLNTIAATVALSIENARVTDHLRKAYEEVRSLNRAKDKAINHLSHELRTPIAILIGSLKSFESRLETIPGFQGKGTLARIYRSLDRIKDIELEVDDIMHGRESRFNNMFKTIFQLCGDELEMLIAEEIGEGSVIEKVRGKIDEIFGRKELLSETINLPEFVEERLAVLKTRFSHREMDLRIQMAPGVLVKIPREVFQKVFDGLLRNAIENTPDEGRIEVTVREESLGVEMIIRDHGIGIAGENQRLIFEGFFSTQETMDYSSRHPFDFNAGGRGADLLRMKIFSERYRFRIDMNSSLCAGLKSNRRACPGRISLCEKCKGQKEDCHDMGGTTFRVSFPIGGKD